MNNELQLLAEIENLLLAEIEKLKLENFRLLNEKQRLQLAVCDSIPEIPEHKFTVKITKITDIESAKKVIETSVNGEFKSKIKDLRKLYASEHSPMYSQIYCIELKNIFAYVSTHIRTHKTHFITESVTSNREDRGGVACANRYTPVNMIIFCNAKTIVEMCRKRLCKKADVNTQSVFKEIRNILAFQDDCLSDFLFANCVYRNGLCGEFKCCGFIDTDKYKYIQSIYNQNFKTPKKC